MDDFVLNLLFLHENQKFDLYELSVHVWDLYLTKLGIITFLFNIFSFEIIPTSILNTEFTSVAWPKFCEYFCKVSLKYDIMSH